MNNIECQQWLEKSRPRVLFSAGLGAALVVLALTPAIGAADKIEFGRDILPILSDNCFQCHGPDVKNRQAELRLDEEAGARRVQDGKAVVVPGKSAESELIRRIISTNADEVMPPAKSQRKLTAAQIDLLKHWIDGGAPWGGHWSLAPLRSPDVPLITAREAEATSPLDSFLLARLAREGLNAAAQAPRETLARRVTLDVTGLPPTLTEASEFVQDQSPDAYERLVDRLLASPAYGERMAWDWLDAARYADSNGYQGDGERTMWPWRDWVVQAFNQNLPYDQFTVWQLAGDMLPAASPTQKMATGFCRNHMINGEGGRIAEENRIEYVMDMTETVGTVWLGLTLNCCRCHDHKFDPVLKREYFALFAFFNQTPVDGGGGNPQTPPIMTYSTPVQQANLTLLEQAFQTAGKGLEERERQVFPRPTGQSAEQAAEAAKLPDPIKAILKLPPLDRNRDQLLQLEKQFEKSPPDYAKQIQDLGTAREQRDNLQSSLPRVMVMEELPQPRKTFLLDKGLYNKPQESVEAGVPASLPPLPPSSPHNRRGLAEWLIAAEQPLTGRVAVNRFWQQFFGVGLVKTAEDFGVQGERPQHPELLDWLAAEFRAGGWDVKRLCRRLVCSAAYRRSSQATAALVERDPENRLLARGPRYRLPAWMLRDQALAASGLLLTGVGGPPVNPYQPSGVWEETTFGGKQYRQDHGASLYRRGLYTFWRRIVGPTMFFDNAARQTCSVKQFRTNTPLHALATLNDVTYVEAARALAERAMLESPTPAGRIELLFRLLLARSPSSAELPALLASLEKLQRHFQSDKPAAEKILAVGESPRAGQLDPAEHAAYAALAAAILNLDEALSKE